MAKKKSKSGDEKGKPNTPHLRNRKAFHDYHILEKVECGMELFGTEIKSLRAGQAKIDESYARIDNGQVYLISATIAAYQQADEKMQHDPTRKRKLLLHRRQIQQLETMVLQKGRTLVPLAVYFKNGWAKCELGIAEGKQLHDKRQSLKERQQKLDIDRELRRR